MFLDFSFRYYTVTCFLKHELSFCDSIFYKFLLNFIEFHLEQLISTFIQAVDPPLFDCRFL